MHLAKISPECIPQTIKMTQWIIFAAKAGNKLSLIFTLHMVEGENLPCKVVLWPPHVCNGVHTQCLCTQMHKHWICKYNASTNNKTQNRHLQLIHCTIVFRRRNLVNKCSTLMSDRHRNVLGVIIPSSLFWNAPGSPDHWKAWGWVRWQGLRRSKKRNVHYRKGVVNTNVYHLNS